MKKPSALKYNERSVHVVYKETGGFRISNKFIEKIIEESKKVNKKPLLSIIIKRNDKENFIINCEIRIENK